MKRPGAVPMIPDLCISAGNTEFWVTCLPRGNQRLYS